MQYSIYSILFWWNLSSASIDRVIFIFLPLNSFLNILADLTYLFLSSSFLKWMKTCVIGFAKHSILAFSIDIPISVIVSFRSWWTWFRCFTVESCYCSFALILVVMGSVGFVFSIFTFFIYVGDFIYHIRDSFIDLFVSVVVFFLHFSQRLCSFHGGWDPTESLIVCRNVSICSSVFFQ